MSESDRCTDDTEHSLNDYLPVRKGDRLEGFPCPRCNESHDGLMDRPALKSVGYNTRSGLLFDCSCCNDRTTEAEIRIGETKPWDKGLMDRFQPNREQYIRPGGPRDNRTVATETEQEGDR